MAIDESREELRVVPPIATSYRSGTPDLSAGVEAWDLSQLMMVGLNRAPLLTAAKY